MTEEIIRILDKDKIKLDNIRCFKFYAVFVLLGSFLIIASYSFIFLDYSLLEPILCIYSVTQVQAYQFCSIAIEHDIELYKANDS